MRPCRKPVCALLARARPPAHSGESGRYSQAAQLALHSARARSRCEVRAPCVWSSAPQRRRLEAENESGNKMKTLVSVHRTSLERLCRYCCAIKVTSRDRSATKPCTPPCRAVFAFFSPSSLQCGLLLTLRAPLRVLAHNAPCTASETCCHSRCTESLCEPACRGSQCLDRVREFCTAHGLHGSRFGFELTILGCAFRFCYNSAVHCCLRLGLCCARSSRLSVNNADRLLLQQRSALHAPQPVLFTDKQNDRCKRTSLR